jgi:hypothetical protein
MDSVNKTTQHELTDEMRVKVLAYIQDVLHNCPLKNFMFHDASHDNMLLCGCLQMERSHPDNLATVESLFLYILTRPVSPISKPLQLASLYSVGHVSIGISALFNISIVRPDLVHINARDGENMSFLDKLLLSLDKWPFNNRIAALTATRSNIDILIGDESATPPLLMAIYQVKDCCWDVHDGDVFLAFRAILARAYMDGSGVRVDFYNSQHVAWPGSSYRERVQNLIKELNDNHRSDFFPHEWRRKRYEVIDRRLTIVEAELQECSDAQVRYRSFLGSTIKQSLSCFVEPAIAHDLAPLVASYLTYK